MRAMETQVSNQRSKIAELEIQIDSRTRKVTELEEENKKLHDDAVKLELYQDLMRKCNRARGN